MSDEQPERPLAAGDRRRPAGDPLLRAFVNMAEDDDGFTVGLTLSVSGAVISGLLVSGGRWWTDLGQDPGDPADQKSLKAVGEGLEEGRADDSGRAFIHLVDAKYVIGLSSVPSNASVFWRGRISEIAGWAFGQIGAGAAQE